MFEKEADFAETKMLINCNGDYSKKKDYKKGWQDGAEFGYNKANEWHYVKDGDLPKENEYICANATERCFRNEIACPCQKYKSYKDENADLKEEINKIAFARGELEKENAELKEKLKNYKQLTEAKDIIKGLLELGSIGDGDYTYVAQAEQFLKEVSE